MSKGPHAWLCLVFIIESVDLPYGYPGGAITVNSVVRPNQNTLRLALPPRNVSLAV